MRKRALIWHRVYYDAAARQEEVWAETSDGACRWRQTGGEVKLIALKVCFPGCSHRSGQHAMVAAGGRLNAM